MKIIGVETARISGFGLNLEASGWFDPHVEGAHGSGTHCSRTEQREASERRSTRISSKPAPFLAVLNHP